MPDKKYLIEIPDLPEGSGIWDADKWERNKDAFMADYPEANVFELGEYDESDSRETDQIMLSFDNDEDLSGIWDADKWERNKDAFVQDYPEAKVNRVRYVDYWGDAAKQNRARREELSQPDVERDARLAEIGYFDDISGEQKQFDVNNPSAMGLKPLSSVIKQNSVSGETEYLDPRVAEFYANDTAYTDKLAERARLDAEYESNPSVIAQREYDAQLARYADDLKKQIESDMESDVDKGKLAKGFARKNMPGTATAYVTSGNLGKDTIGERLENEKYERYSTAVKLLDKAKIARDVAGKGFGGAVIDWAKEGFMDKTTQSDIEAYNEIGNILSRIEKEVGALKPENITEEVFDKYLSKDEQALIKAFFEYNSAMAEAQQDMSGWYKGGKIFAESIPFMLEFLATGGLYKAAGRASTRGLEKALVKWITKSTGKSVASVGRKVLSSNAIGLARALAGTTARTLVSPGTYDRLAEASLEIDDEGHLNRAKNAAISLADSYVENLSEISGGLIGKGLGYLGKGAGKLAKTLGGAPLAKIGSWLGDQKLVQGLVKGWTAAAPKLEMLGFHGLPEEIGEEFIGNTIREFGIQPGALEEMVSDDNFGAMLIGFAPMTLLGAAGGAISIGVVNAKASKLGEELRQMFSNHHDTKEIDFIMQSLSGATTAKEIKEMLKPMEASVMDALSRGMITREQAIEEIEMLYQYGGFIAQNNALLFGQQARENELATAKRAEMVDRYGRFWQQDETETVEVATLNNGSTVFVTSAPAEDGKIAIVDAVTGKKGFANTSDIVTREVDGEQIQATNKMSMAAFLNGQIAMQRKTEEETRMANERNAQIDALRAQVTPGTRLNLGTEGSPVYVFAKKVGANGVTVVDETGMETLLGWDQAADALGQPIVVETDQQKLDAEISARLQRLAERRMQSRVAPATQAATEEAAQETAEAVAQEQRHIPMNEDGTVNEAAFWMQDPEGYVQWNDEQNKDGGQDSLRQIAIAKQELIALLAEAATGQNTSNPTMRKAAEKEAKIIADKIARLEALEQSYMQSLEEEKAAIQQTAAEEVAAEQIAPRISSQMSEEEKVQMDTQYENILRQTRTKTERVRLLQEYVNKISEGSMPAVVITKDNFKESMRAAECSEALIARVEFFVKAGQNIGAFIANGHIFLMEDGLPSMEEARISYVHERQHAFNSSRSEFVQKVVDAVNGNRSILLGWLSTFMDAKSLETYKDDNAFKLADEVIARCMEIAYTTEEFSVDLQSRGIPSEVISTITEIDNEQRFTQSYLNARRGTRRTPYDNVSGLSNMSEDGRNLEQVSGGILEQQETRSSSTGDGRARAGQAGEGAEPAEVDPEAQLNEDGFEVDEQNEDARFSVRYLPTPDQREGIIDSIVAVTGRTRDEAERWLESELSLASIVLTDQEYLDYAPDAKYKAIKDNSDYPQGTVDFNNICRKRKDFTRMYTRLQRSYPNRIFTAEDLADIRTVMSEDGLTVACGLCYVEDRRQKLGEVANAFIEDLQDGFRNYAKKNATKKANAAQFAVLVSGDTYVPSIYDLITLEGSDKLYEEHRGIWEAFGAYNRARGQQTQNTFQGYAEYKREILTWSDAKVKKVNSLGGLRIFSYSDFEAHHLLDIIQIIIDCAARGVMIQGYTKVPEFARVVEKTGIKLNRSLIPLGDTGIVDGKLAYDPIEGIDINDPNFRESNDNVGNILIGINDEQIRMAMADPFIHYIIPYHARQAGNIRAKLNVGAWTNYIDTHNERKMSDGKRVEKNINIYTDVLDESITNDREFVEKYLEVCREKGYIPKFDQFLDKDAEGNYVYTPGYYKFLVDFKLFDEQGNILPQKPVIAEFDDAFNAQILNDYSREERETAGAAMNATYDKIVETLDLGEPTEGKDVQFRTSEGPVDILEEARKIVEREDGVAFRVISDENYEMAQRIINNLAGDTYFRRLGGEYELGKLASNYAELADIIMAIDANKNYTPVGTALLGFFAENPDMHYPLLFNDSKLGKETAKAFAEELSKVNDPYALFFMKEAWRIHKGSLEQAGLGVKPSSTTKFNKAVDARAEEIKAAEVKGTAFNFKKQESSLEEIDVIFKQLNKDPELALLHDRVMSVARTLGVKVSFAGKRGRTAGESIGDKVSYDYKFFNSPAVSDQSKCNTITHELIHSITVYAIYLRSQAPSVLSDGMLEAVDILHDVYNQIARDPAFKGEYGVSDVYEMVAELSNAQFRDKLKEKNLFQRILDALKRLLGIDTVKEDSAYQVLSDTLDYIIDNYDQAAFDAYALYASKSKSYGRMMKIEEAPSFRITSEQDKAYMDAVEAGDMETAQRMVIEAAKIAMPNTKVVDENGNPKVVYHQTNAKIYVNRETGQNWDNLNWKEKMEWNERDDWEDYWEEQDFNTFSRINARTTNEFDGFFFAPKFDEYHEYGDRTIAAFVNITNPASREDYNIDSTQNDAGRRERIRLQEAGFDGVIRMDGEEVDEYIAFESSQIKSAEPVTYDDNGNVIPLSERFNPENEDIRFRTSNNNQAIFVSNAAKAVEGIKQQKATPEQWLKMIEKNGGLKAGEDKWMGLSDWLKTSDKKTLTKQEVLDFINENMIVIEEQHYSDEEVAASANKELNDKYPGWEDAFSFEWDSYIDEPYASIWDAEIAVGLYNDYHEDRIKLDEDGEFDSMEDEDKVAEFGKEIAEIYYRGNSDIRPIHGTRSDYQTRGLSNNREIALTVPSIESWAADDAVHFGDAGEGRAVAWIRFGETWEQRPSPQISRKVLVIDEIQSKRHQEGREKGYKKDSYSPAAREIKRYFISTRDAYNAYQDQMAEKYGNDFKNASSEADFREILTNEEFTNLLNLRNEWEAAGLAYGPYKGGIPDAPFDKNWHELAMKRMLRYAAENGYDVIAWTTGDQQANRYNLSRDVKKISVYPSKDGSRTINIHLFDRENDFKNLVVDSEGIVTFGEYKGRALTDVVGKETALKIMGATRSTEFAGDNLKVGGEGMRGFYDKMLPAFMNKYGKKWGVKVEDIDLPNLGRYGYTMHSVPVTEEMKASVMEGQVMFRVRGENESAEEFHGKAIANYLQTFNEVAPIKIGSLESKAALAKSLDVPEEKITDEVFEAILAGYEQGGYGGYIDALERIVIFAREEANTTELLEQTLFHESIHKIDFMDIEDGEEFGEWLWENADNIEDLSIFRDMIEASPLYEDDGFAEEMLANSISWYMMIGEVDNLLGQIPEEFRETLNTILNEIGYETEDQSRLRQDPKSVYARAKRLFRQTVQDAQRKRNDQEGIQENEIGYDRRTEEGRREAERILQQSSGANNLGEPEGIQKNEDSEEGLTAEERRVINEYFPGAFPEGANEEYPDNTGEFSEGEGDIRFKVVTDPAKIEELENGPTIKVYRAMQLIDGKLYPPMSAKVDGQLREPIELGQWEEAEERPDLADNKGYFKLDKGNKKSLKARYNPYFHTSPTPLNDQFSSAQSRPELVTVEVEIPASELTSGYKAEKAKDGVGKVEWKAGVVQNKLSGTRTVILSRWDKPIRIVPDSEVADEIVKMFEGKDIVMPSNVVTPSLRAELEKRGVSFAETDNMGKPISKFGPIYEQFRGKPKEAVEFLMEKKTGEAVGALNHKDIGDISIVYGNEKAGLKKIAVKHPEVLDILQDILNDAIIVQQSENRIKLESDRYFAVISKDYLGEPRAPWLLTSFEKKNSVPDNTMDTGETSKGSKQNDTATLQDTVSESKDSDNIDTSNELDENTSFRVNENPTEAQKEAGNYKMGHLNLDGYRITIENPKGSVRRGTDSKGNAWENTLNNDYGYIRGTEGVDGDHIDVYLSDNPSEGNVFVIDQVNPDTREFDEHKVMYGFNSAEEAREAYLANFSEGWNGLGTITEVSKDEFKKWIQSSHRKTKPFSEYKSVNAIGSQSEGMEDEVMLRVTGTPTDEVVASGLSLSPAQTADLAGNIFAALPESARAEVTASLNGDILGLQDAIMQIPARLAMKENWDETDKELASVVREKVQDIVDANGPTSRPLTTKEALWMLHNTGDSYDLISAATDAIVARNLGFDPESIRRRKDVDDYIRFRAGSQGAIDAATDMYNYETSLWTERLKESWSDMNLSVVALQNAISQASGMPIEPWENVVYALNRLSSKSYADKQKYLRDYLIPLWDTILDIVKHDHVSIEDIERYMMLKHALERNEVFAKRDAKEFYRGMYDEVARRMKSQSHAEKVVALSEAKKALADIDAQIATATGTKLQKLKDERVNAQYKVDVADLALRGDEKQNEKDLQDYYDNIDAGTDPKYREFREKDYGGLTAMYTTYVNVRRSNYKSEEAYQQAVLANQQPIYDNVADMESAARMEVDNFENKVYMHKALWDKVNAATKETLRHQYESGMITVEQYEAVRDMFTHYVPLRGFADNTAEDMYSYYMNNSSNGFSMPIIGAKGRKTRAESPLGWIGTMAESAIQADNKNEAKMCLYYAVLRRPDQNLLSITDTWFEYSHTENGKKVYKPAYPPKTDRVLNADELRQHMEDWEKDMKSKQAQGKAFKGTQAVNLRGSVIFQDDKQEKEHIIRVKVAGKDYSILINGNPRAAQAINGLLNPDANVGPIEEWIGWARRGLSSLLTSFSPLFWVANFQRDILSSVERTSESEDIAEAFKYANNRRKAWRVASYLYKMENGTLGDTYYEKLYKEFAENGGITGYTDLTSNKEYEKLLADYAKEVRNPSVIKWAKKVFRNFISFGEAIEQVSRFAAFVTARESGKSLEEAIYAAKEVSVNFNRKGSAQPISRDELKKLRTKDGQELNGVQKVAAIVLSAMPKYLKWAYFFFNASVQAISSKIKLTKKRPGMAAAWAGAYFGMSIALAWIFYLLGDDDDEYLDLPDYLRHSTVLIKVSDEYYFKWSIPQEMRPFYAWGDMIVSKMMGKMPHKNLGKEMALAALQWLPVNPFEAEDPLLSLVPDVLSPVVEAAANKTSFGGKIYDDMAFKSEGTVQDIPAYRKATDKTGKVYVELSEILNAISGGDEVQKGWANINPAALEHLVEGYGGGIYDFAKMMVAFPGLVIDAATGEKEMEIKNIPFVNKVVMSVDETNMYSHTNDAFYHYKGIAESAKRIEKEYAESDDPSRAEAYREEDDWRIYLLYKQYEEDFKDVKEALDNAVDDTETDLLKQEQNVLREMFLNDIAKGELPEITFEIREDIKRIEKDVKKIMKPADDANKERLERKKAGDVDGMVRAIERRDSLKDTPEYQRAEEISKEVKAIKKQLQELGTVERRSQRDSVIGELQRNYERLKERMSDEISQLP